VKLTPRKPITADSNVGRGIEFALGTALFLGIGYALDRWLGTQPVFTICLFFVGVIGQFATMWYRYNDAMNTHDAERLAARQAHRSSAGSAATSGKTAT
jgi:F0F1-type ATP synthase assembly protein I